MWISVIVTHLAHDQKTKVRILYPLIFYIIIKLNPNDEIGKHNKLKTCRLIALKVRVLFRIIRRNNTLYKLLTQLVQYNYIVIIIINNY